MGLDNAPNKQLHNISLKKIIVYSGTIPNHHCNTNLASKQAGREIKRIRKKKI